MQSVNFILGNDIGFGGRVMPLLEICDKLDFSASDELSEEFPEVFSVCAITRAQAHKFADADDLFSTFIEKVVSTTFVNDVLMVDDHFDEKSVLSSSNNLKLHVTRDNLIAAQQDDFTLHTFFLLLFLQRLHRGERLFFHGEWSFDV